MICFDHFLIFQVTYLRLLDFETDETDEEDENKEYVAETNRDVAAIAACKLVNCGVVPKVITKCIDHAAVNIIVITYQSSAM